MDKKKDQSEGKQHKHDNKMVSNMDDAKKLGKEMENLKNDEEKDLKQKGKVPDPQITG